MQKSSESVSGWWIAQVINTEKEGDLLSVVELRCFSAPWTSCFKITGDRVSLGKGLNFYWKPTTFKWLGSWRTIKLSNSPIIKSFIWQIFHCWGNSCVFPPLAEEIKPLAYANCWQGMETNGLLNMSRDTLAPSHSLMEVRAIHKSRAARTELWFCHFSSDRGSELGKISLFLEGSVLVGGVRRQEKVFYQCSPPKTTHVYYSVASVDQDPGTGGMGSFLMDPWSGNPAGIEFPSEDSAGGGIMSPLRVSVSCFQFLGIVAWIVLFRFCWLLFRGHPPSAPNPKFLATWTSPTWPLTPLSQKAEPLGSLQEGVLHNIM